MKILTTIIFTILLTVGLNAQDLVLEQSPDGTLSAAQITYLSDEDTTLYNKEYLALKLDSADMQTKLFQFAMVEFREEARRKSQGRLARIGAGEFIRLNNNLNYSDSTFIEWTTDNLASTFAVKDGNFPNYKLRVDGQTLWAKAWLNPNGVLIFGITNENGSLVSPRDVAAFRIFSDEGFTINSLTATGENLDFYVFAVHSNRIIWEAEKSDGSFIRLSQLINR